MLLADFILDSSLYTKTIQAVRLFSKTKQTRKKNTLKMMMNL